MTESMVNQQFDAWCYKCQLTLTHLVMTMKEDKIHKVKCKTCKHVHVFRQKPRQRKAAVPKPVQPTEYELRMRRCDASTALPYRLDGTYKRDDVIDHSKLGVGLVITLLGARKMEVLFPAGPVLLMQGL